MADDARTLLREDAAARERALDASASFLVQAPAGSGKTELLIQRCLALLAIVDEPERIVALTFTRKAAGEMRERVLRALLGAREGASIEPGRDHEHRTRELARAALRQDARMGWSLTEHPARLSVHTFDALAASIARRAPVAAALGPMPSFQDDASDAYRAAAVAAIRRAGADDRHWRALLAHLDNDAARAAELIADLLRRRDQWQRQLGGGIDAGALRKGLEDALRADVEAVLAATRAAFPSGASREIRNAMAVAAAGLAQHEKPELRAFGEALAACEACGGLPPATHDALPHWRALARFLLVGKSAAFRRSVNRNDGFVAGGNGAQKAARDAAKAAMLSLCESLQAVPGLAESLCAAGRLPPPSIDDAAWNVVEALMHVLPLAHAELLVVFDESRAVDFVEGSLRAMDALGTADAPSDLLLRLDARIDHLLVDEFQDTSFAQLELLRRLTAGWSGDASRTLFAVGDPMQSIYRFREAEVRLFVEAQARREIAGLPVETLVLRRNFRSQARIVDWTNEVFRAVLGEVSAPARGAVRFEAATPHKPARPHGPTIERCADEDDEARRVVQRVRDALASFEQEAADGKDAPKVAILVRARGHLAAILPALREAGIPYAAIDLDTLAQRQAMLDLAALAFALVQPADRVAWLAVLRAPWCGLALPDLFAVVEAAGSADAPLLPACDDPAVRARLSPQGGTRLAATMAVLRPALEARGRATLAARVRGAWLALGGPACLDDALDLDAAERFFETLSEHERAGDLPDRAAFERALAALLAAPADAARARIHVMTMHKAKGLEFDTVILPGLACRPHGGETPLVRWRRRERGLIVAPMQSRGGGADPVYRYLADLDRQEEDAELGRLLYVACTRAKSRLHLIAAPGVGKDKATGEEAWKNPVKGSSLAKLGPAVVAQADGAPPMPVDAIRAAETAPPLRRLPPGHRVEEPQDFLPAPQAAASPALDAVPFDWAAEVARATGVVAHRLLARIAAEGADDWTPARLEGLLHRVARDFEGRGFTAEEARRATARVGDAVRRTLDDPKGRWLFDPAHEDARSEWALSGVDGDAVAHVVLDRTFVSDGVRWIVDFKTGTHEGADAGAFLASEVERYRPQLERYARFVSALDPARPIRLALYYPLVDGGFREWVPVVAAGAS